MTRCVIEMKERFKRDGVTRIERHGNSRTVTPSAEGHVSESPCTETYTESRDQEQTLLRRTRDDSSMKERLGVFMTAAHSAGDQQV